VRVKKDGNRCGNWARPGATTCRFHLGNSPHVQEKAMQRLTFAELLRHDPRPIAEVIIESVAISDAAMMDLKMSIMDEHAETGTVTADNLTRLFQYAERANKLAKAAHDAGIAELQLRQRERDLNMETQIVVDTVTALGTSLVTALGLDPLRTKAMDGWVLAATAAALTGEPIPDPPLADVAVGVLEPAGATDTRAGADTVPTDALGPETDQVHDAVVVDDEPAEPAPAEPAPAPVVKIKRAHSPDPAGASPWGRGQGPMSAVVGERPRPRDGWPG
jgi:hypothetical protein